VDNNDFIYCDSCGAPMNPSQRCCLKCGALNYLHKDNESMEEISKKNIKKSKTFIIGQNGMNDIISNNQENVHTLYADNTGSRKFCFTLNSILFLISITFLSLFYLLRTYGAGSFRLNDINFYLLSIIFSLGYIELLSMENIFMKANYPWWAAFIPFYNSYVLSKIVFDKGWLFLLGFIPFVNIVYFLFLLFNLGKIFSTNRILTMIFPVVMIPVIAFHDSCCYKKIYYVDIRQSSFNTKSPEEITYRMNRLAIMIPAIILLVLLSLFIAFNYRFILDFITNLWNKINSYRTS